MGFSWYSFVMQGFIASDHGGFAELEVATNHAEPDVGRAMREDTLEHIDAGSSMDVSIGSASGVKLNDWLVVRWRTPEA